MALELTEALAVLEKATLSPRAQAALSALQAEIGSGDRASDSKLSSEKPSFPDAKSVAEHFGDDDERQGRATAGNGQGLATARKGSS